MTTTDTGVTQADRNAAEPILGPAAQTCSADHPVLQILARHRTLTPAQAAGPVLLEALRMVDYSIRQARIPGNDWKRELRLIENLVKDAITQAEGPQA